MNRKSRVVARKKWLNFVEFVFIPITLTVVSRPTLTQDSLTTSLVTKQPKTIARRLLLTYISLQTVKTCVDIICTTYLLWSVHQFEFARKCDFRYFILGTMEAWRLGHFSDIPRNTFRTHFNGDYLGRKISGWNRVKALATSPQAGSMSPVLDLGVRSFFGRSTFDRFT